MACARIGQFLMTKGFVAEDARTADHVAEWAQVDFEAVRRGASAEFLRSTGQQEDIDFVIEHVNDVDLVVLYDGTEAKADGPARQVVGS